MKNLIFWIGVLFLILAALATPIAIGLGLYDWVVNDAEFKYALWFGFKSWISMLVLAAVVGFSGFIAGK